MAPTTALRVRVLSLGDAAGRSLPQVLRALHDLWGRDGGVAIEGSVGNDDPRSAARAVRRWCDHDHADVVFTVGRAGPAPGDYAPEATAALLDRALPGVEERMCLAPPSNPDALLFRGKAGMRGGTLVVNLPERPAFARRIVAFLRPVVRHAVEKARGSDGECVPPGAGR